MLVNPSGPEGSSGAFGLGRRDLAGTGRHPNFDELGDHPIL